MTNDTFRKAKMIHESLCEISNLRVIINNDFRIHYGNRVTGREEIYTLGRLGEYTEKEIISAIHGVLTKREKELKAEFEEL
jgi:hypothetical protein